MYDRRQVIQNLDAGMCHIVFRKANGEVTSRFATRNPQFLARYGGVPQGGDPGKQQMQEYNDEVKGIVRFFDLNKREWRSFYVQTLQSLKFVSNDSAIPVPPNPDIYRG